MANINTFNTFDSQTDQRAIERQRQLAQLLQAQAFQQEPNNQMAGGYVVRNSPLAGIAKVLAAYTGAKNQQDLDLKEKELSQQTMANRQQTLASALRMAQGTPERDAMVDPQELEQAADQGTNYPNPRMPAVPGDQQGAAAMLAGANDPMLATMGTSLLAKALQGPENLFSKVDPKDYTPQSVAAYASSRKPEDLVPVRKMDVVPLGGTSRAMNLYDTPAGTDLAHTITPDTSARVNQQERQFSNLSAYQKAELPIQLGNLNVARTNASTNIGQLRNAQQNTYFNTGMGPGSVFATAAGAMPTGTPGPATGPRSAVPAPSLPSQGPIAPAAPGLTPHAASDVAKAGALKQQENRMALPQTIATAQQQLDLIDQMVGKEGDVKSRPHPGFESAVGMRVPGLGYIPGTDTSGFNRLLEQVKGGAFMTAYQNLRGGGQITEVEGKKATDAITRMDNSQSEAEFKKAAREFQSVIRAGIERAKGLSGVAPSGSGFKVLGVER